MIPFTPGMTTELAKRGANRRWRYFIEMEFKSGTDRFWTGEHSISFNGQTWLPLVSNGDDVETLGAMSETSAGDFEPIEMVFVIVDPARLVQLLAADEIEERPIRLYKGLYDLATKDMLPDPYMVWDRLMKSGAFDGQTKRWALSAESRFKRALFKWRRTRSHADQKEWAAVLGEANDEGLIDVTSFPQARRAWPAANWTQVRGT